jgi:polyhydroxyalkanoate synthase
VVEPATTGLHGVTRRHEEVVAFAARQILDVFSPANFVPTNPEVIERVRRTGGGNFVEGGRNWLEDTTLLLAGEAAPLPKGFAVGRDVAVTRSRSSSATT